MNIATYRAGPLAKGRFPFAQPRSSGWQESRAAALALVLGPAAAVVGVRAAVAARRSRGGPTGAAARGYRRAPENEQAAVNLLSAYLLTLAGSRAITYVLEQRETARPWRFPTKSPRRVHHFVPGIVIAFASATAGVLTRGSSAEPWLALPLGSGMALTLDEAALLLRLEDLYWRRERVALVQGAVALAAGVGLAARLLGRSEHDTQPRSER